MSNELQEVRHNQRVLHEKVDRLVVLTDPEQKNESAAMAEIEATEARDRKRFKERLKKEAFNTMAKKEKSWIEYIFGICPGDQRMGKEGSRYIRFYV
jgi:hypothetical protein